MKKKQRLTQINKEDLFLKQEELYMNIIKRTNNTLYSNYLDLKKIIEINEIIYGTKKYDKIAERLGYRDPSYVNYLLRFKNLKDVEWLNKIPANVILLTVSFNDETEEKQDEYLKIFEERKYDVNKARIYLIKEYIKGQELENNMPHVLYMRLNSILDDLSKFINISAKSTMVEEERIDIKEKIELLNEKAKEVL